MKFFHRLPARNPASATAFEIMIAVPERPILPPRFECCLARE